MAELVVCNCWSCRFQLPRLEARIAELEDALTRERRVGNRRVVRSDIKHDWRFPSTFVPWRDLQEMLDG